VPNINARINDRAISQCGDVLMNTVFVNEVYFGATIDVLHRHRHGSTCSLDNTEG